VIFLLENYDGPEPINVGTGVDLPTQEFAQLVAEVVGFRGSRTNDLTKPDGTPQKQLDVPVVPRERGVRPGVAFASASSRSRSVRR